MFKFLQLCIRINIIDTTESVFFLFCLIEGWPRQNRKEENTIRTSCESYTYKLVLAYNHVVVILFALSLNCIL